MRVSAKADYAVRAAVDLAAAEHVPVRSEDIAARQGIPANFLVKILHELRVAGIVLSQRGPDGGHQLARSADQISIADILRAVEGPLADVRGTPPEKVRYSGSAVPLQRVWVALRTNVRGVLETVSVADVAEDKLPRKVNRLADQQDSWVTR